MDATTVVPGQQGRLVIPAEARDAPGLVERQPDAAAELRGLAAAAPTSRSLVAELLAERRAAAAGE